MGAGTRFRPGGVWSRTLRFERIGVHDNFFELGGDSLSAVQVVSRLQDELKIELPVAKLYQGLTVRTLAALLARDEEAASAERAAQLEERRESMDRRRELLERRRTARRGEAL
jgi:L-serine---[L-seryl-carrier protein] ligase